jgi:hypothetical protein
MVNSRNRFSAVLLTALSSQLTFVRLSPWDVGVEPHANWMTSGAARASGGAGLMDSAGR